MNPDITDPTNLPITAVADYNDSKRRYATICNIVYYNTGGQLGHWTSIRTVKSIYCQSNPAADPDNRLRSSDALSAITAAVDHDTLYRYGDQLTVATRERLTNIQAAEADSDTPNQELIAALNSHLTDTAASTQ